MSTYAIKADKFYLPAAPAQGGYLIVEDDVFGMWQAEAPDCEIRDYTGSWIAPGLVDTHIHGFFNHATTDFDPEGFDIASAKLCTSYAGSAYVGLLKVEFVVKHDKVCVATGHDRTTEILNAS